MLIVLPIRLGSLNEYITACRRNPHAGNLMKRRDEGICSKLIRQQCKKHFGKVHIDYLWIEPNSKRDKDNISSYGRKVIQDALVSSGVIDNDGWKQIEGFSDSFGVDKNNPRIEIRIREVNNEL